MLASAYTNRLKYGFLVAAIVLLPIAATIFLSDTSNESHSNVNGYLSKYENRTEIVQTSRGNATQYNVYFWLENREQAFIYREFEDSVFNLFPRFLNIGDEITLKISNRTSLIEGMDVNGATLIDYSIHKEESIADSFWLALLGTVCLIGAIVIQTVESQRGA